MAGRVLVIRGGAIGDFILTLPALHLLKDHLPNCHVEILGYRHIIQIAEGRFYAEKTRSIEYAPLAGFFARGGTQTDELVTYFRSFDQVISYLYDPDELFRQNLRSIGVTDPILGPGRLDDTAHATSQLARPLEDLGMYLEDPTLRIYPSTEDRIRAAQLLPGSCSRIALHPGSGGRHKVWPTERWARALAVVAERHPEVEWVVIGGEADTAAIEYLRQQSSIWHHPIPLRWMINLELPILGAVLERCGRYLGHDSGISHLAAAAGCECLLLFGPTDPKIWAPLNPKVQILCPRVASMEAHETETITTSIFQWLES